MRFAGNQTALSCFHSHSLQLSSHHHTLRSAASGGKEPTSNTDFFSSLSGRDLCHKAKVYDCVWRFGRIFPLHGDRGTKEDRPVCTHCFALAMCQRSGMFHRFSQLMRQTHCHHVFAWRTFGTFQGNDHGAPFFSFLLAQLRLYAKRDSCHVNQPRRHRHPVAQSALLGM